MIIKEKNWQHRNSRGFSIVELLIVVLIIGILTTLALMIIVQARSSFRFSNAVGTLQIHLEKAITDAKRRNAKGDSRATIKVLNTKSYQIKIDFDGDGNAETQTVNLPEGTSFLYGGSAPQATIDWRGYIAEGTVIFVVKADSGQTSEVTLTNRGDASTDSDFPTMPTITVTPVSSDVKSTTVLSGNSTPNPNASPTPYPTALPVCSAQQIPANNNCRCPNGMVIDSKSGKCKSP
jgi:prepilin-type N-terminal cleavage/methylation domain-containing protein